LGQMAMLLGTGTCCRS